MRYWILFFLTGEKASIIDEEDDFDAWWKKKDLVGYWLYAYAVHRHKGRVLSLFGLYYIWMFYEPTSYAGKMTKK